MAKWEKTYLCIDLKTFYASVECVDRGLDPFEANLVVADPDRGPTTICLAVSPAMKAQGVRNRCRVFEIPSGIDYTMAPPRMRRYMEVSADIYSIYRRYVAAEDMHVYSVDECFIDATSYLGFYGLDARGFAVMLMDAVFAETGICATAGIGTNLFLAKVALDITAKHAPDCIGVLDEEEFRRTIWHHRPITDVWNVGPGIARRLEKYGVHDLFGVCWLDEGVLYREFGVNAAFLIDHAHGEEPCTIRQIHDYVPRSSSICNGQILEHGYSHTDARLVLREMVEESVLGLVDDGLAAGSISLAVGYELPAWERSFGDAPAYQGEHGLRGRGGPHTGGTRRLPWVTSSYHKVMGCFDALYEETALRDRPVKRIQIGLGDLVPERYATPDLFDGERDEREHRAQQAMLAVNRRFGKTCLRRASSLTEATTLMERSRLVGGHRG